MQNCEQSLRSIIMNIVEHYKVLGNEIRHNNNDSLFNIERHMT